MPEFLVRNINTDCAPRVQDERSVDPTITLRRGAQMPLHDVDVTHLLVSDVNCEPFGTMNYWTSTIYSTGEFLPH